MKARGEIPWPYSRCDACGKVIRLNKPFVGDLHICLTRAERERVEQEYKVEFHRRGRLW